MSKFTFIKSFSKSLGTLLWEFKMRKLNLIFNPIQRELKKRKVNGSLEKTCIKKEKLKKQLTGIKIAEWLLKVYQVFYR